MIYTKTGDSGQTSLLGGTRVSKDCITLQVVGAIDELNSVLGVARSHTEHQAQLGALSALLRVTQKDLFKVGAEVAGIQNDSLASGEKVGDMEISQLETAINEWCDQMPELKNFILPGGNLAGAHLHQARTVCRRVERELVHLGKEINLRPELYQYLNRLSDFLFVAARYVNFKSGVEEDGV